MLWNQPLTTLRHRVIWKARPASLANAREIFGQDISLGERHEWMHNSVEAEGKVPVFANPNKKGRISVSSDSSTHQGSRSLQWALGFSTVTTSKDSMDENSKASLPCSTPSQRSLTDHPFRNKDHERPLGGKEENRTPPSNTRRQNVLYFKLNQSAIPKDWPIDPNDFRLDSYFDESEKLKLSADLKCEYGMPNPILVIENVGYSLGSGLFLINGGDGK